MYTLLQQIGKQNNLKIFEGKNIKGSKQDSPNLYRLRIINMFYYGNMEYDFRCLTSYCQLTIRSHGELATFR
jgi:hypothetical protein